MSGPTIICLREIHFRYDRGQPPALQGVTLEVAGGTVTALLGPNGAGKTTVLHLLVGLLRPQKGVALLAGRPSASYGRSEMGRLVALVPQVEYTPFDFSVRDFVLLGRAPYLMPLEQPGQEDRREAQAALEAAGAGHLAGRTISALSGGERQLVSIARALAQRPQILLLDEPTAHLDLANRARLLRLLRSLAGGGAAVVFSTQDPQAAAAAADEVVLMRAGRVLASGPARETLNAQNLSTTYGLPVEVGEVAGQRVILTPLG